MPHSVLPTELLREILNVYILSIQGTTSLIGANSSPNNLTLEGYGSSKPDWHFLSSISLVSKTFRALALEAWFSTLYIKSPDDLLDRNIPFPEIKTQWTRKIHIEQMKNWDSSTWNLQGFIRLSTLRIDCKMRDSLPERFPFFPAESESDAESAPSELTSIKEVDIRGISWPSPLSAWCIAKTFPALQVLRMRQSSIWCGLCHTCCIPRFASPSPKVVKYEDGTGLPLHYSRAFALLPLEAVHLTVGCIEKGKTTLGSDSDDGKGSNSNNPNLWSGECDRCIGVMYEDDEFRRKWVEKKTSLDSAVNPRPPKLGRVEWKFWEIQDDELHDDDDWEDLFSLIEAYGEDTDSEEGRAVMNSEADEATEIRS